MAKILLEDCHGEFLPDKNSITLKESAEGVTEWYNIPGRLSVCGIVNGNGRRYGKKVWEANLKEGSPLRQLIERNASFGALEHPADGQLTLNSPLSHLVTKVWFDESHPDELHGEIRILNTPSGNIIKALIEAGWNPTVSSRGFGSLEKASDGIDEVQEDFICEGWDIVMKPSFVQAVLTPKRESKVESASAPLHQTFSSLTEFEKFDAITHYSKTLGFKSTRDCWMSNPAVKPITEEKKEASVPAVAVKAQSSKIEVVSAPATTVVTNFTEAAKVTEAAKPKNDAPIKPSKIKENKMDAKTIQESIRTVKAISAKDLTPTALAEGLSHVAELHNEVAKYAAEDASRSWEAGQLHEQLSLIEKQWSAEAAAPKAQVKKLSEDNAKLLQVVKAVATTGIALKGKLTESVKKIEESGKLAEEIVKRGRKWKARAEALEAKAVLIKKKYDYTCEALDFLVSKYKGDITILGKKLVETEFAGKLTPEVQEALKKATHPKHIVAVREKLSPSKKVTEAEAEDINKKENDSKEDSSDAKLSTPTDLKGDSTGTNVAKEFVPAKAEKESGKSDSSDAAKEAFANTEHNVGGGKDKGEVAHESKKAVTEAVKPLANGSIISTKRAFNLAESIATTRSLSAAAAVKTA